MEMMLEIENLTKVYGRGAKMKTAVTDLSLNVPRGSFFGLLGPNGAGKSTTIGCVTGTNKITSGTITVGGLDVETDYKAARQKIGISPQEFNVDIFARADKLLDYMGGYYGIPATQRAERIDELIERFHLTEHRAKKFQELSGGLKRRTILARAMVHDPELLILDEPTAGVDVEQRYELWQYLRDLHKAGKTIILTSHYLEEIEALCNEVAIIDGGKLVACDTMAAMTRDGSLEKTYLEITNSSNT